MRWIDPSHRHFRDLEVGVTRPLLNFFKFFIFTFCESKFLQVNPHTSALGNVVWYFSRTTRWTLSLNYCQVVSFQVVGYIRIFQNALEENFEFSWQFLLVLCSKHDQWEQNCHLASIQHHAYCYSPKIMWINYITFLWCVLLFCFNFEHFIYIYLTGP